MGRKRNIFIRDFFDYDGRKSVCRTCGAVLKGDHVTNLKRHITSKHPELYASECELYENNIKNSDNGNKKVKFTVEYSRNEVRDACVGFIADHALPLSFFDTQSFKVFSRQIFEGLQMSPLNSSNIVEVMQAKYIEVKNLIVKKLRGKVLSLKMDSATRHERSMLAINVQVIEKEKIVIYTLTVKEMHQRQTAENLKNEVDAILNEFEISNNQIYSITTDNGRNMIKATELFSNSNVSSTINDEDQSDYDCSEIERINEVFCGENRSAISVKCAAHTLQLAVKDFLIVNNHTEVVTRSRQIVKILRTPTLRYSLEILDLGKPQLDVPTRWNSTFIMLQKLLQFKEFCDTNLKEPLTETEWDSIKKLVAALKPVYEATMKLQEEQSILGDFYVVWLNMRAQLEQMNCNTASLVLGCIKSRESNLLNIDVLGAALFLDPRLRRTLGSEKKESAKNHLKKVAAQMISVRRTRREGYSQPSTSRPAQNTTSSINELSFDESSVQSASSLLRQTIQTLELDSSSDDEQVYVSSEELRKAYAEIDTYREQRVDIEMNLLKYWEEKRFLWPTLRELALIVHAVPATQVSVERVFSALRH